MENMKVFIFKLSAIILLIISCFFIFVKIIVFSEEYITSVNYKYYVNNPEETVEIYRKNYDYTEEEARLISDVISSKGASLGQGKKILDIMLKDKDDTNYTSISMLRVIYMIFYVITIILYCVTLISHFFGTKNKGLLVICLNIIWLCIVGAYCQIHDVFQMSGYVILSLFFSIWSTGMCFLADSYKDTESEYTLLDLITGKKKCWIKRLIGNKTSESEYVGEKEDDRLDFDEGIYKKAWGDSVDKKIKNVKCRFCSTLNDIDASYCWYCKRDLKEEKGKVIFSGDKEKDIKEYKEEAEEKILELFVVYDDIEFEKARKSCMRSCCICNADNSISSHICKVCGEILY